MQLELCLCDQIPELEVKTKLVLVMHRREALTTTATGPLALQAIANHEWHLHGVRDQPLDLNYLHEEGRRVLILYPSEDARELSEELLAEDDRPATLVVPDGSWRQASRAAKRIPGLEKAERVTLPAGPPTEWGMRREPKMGGLSTFEAIARSLGVLEGELVQSRLEALFREMVKRQKSLRPYELPGEAPPEPQLEILYQDQWIVVVNKPSGQLVHRGWAQDGEPVLQTLRDQIGQRVFPVHRLDRATSGALLFALSSEMTRDLQALFEAGAVDKRYLALCRGHDPELSAIEHPLTKEPGEGERKYARTEVSLLDHHGRYGLYEARPITGRAHQIRRHLKHVAHPIIGDVRYGKGEHNRHFREEYGFGRLALHCTSLAFDHPRTGESLKVSAKLPEDLRSLFAALNLLSAAESLGPQND